MKLNEDSLPGNRRTSVSGHLTHRGGSGMYVHVQGEIALQR